MRRSFSLGYARTMAAGIALSACHLSPTVAPTVADRNEVLQEGETAAKSTRDTILQLSDENIMKYRLSALALCKAKGVGIYQHPDKEIGEIDCEQDQITAQGMTFQPNIPDKVRLSGTASFPMDVQSLPENPPLNRVGLIEYMKNLRVITFGETHDRTNEFFLNLLPLLKEEGFTHIGPEFPSQFEPIAEFMIQRYENGAAITTVNDLPEDLKNRYKHLDQEIFSRNIETLSKIFVPIFAQAKKLGFELVFVDDEMVFSSEFQNALRHPKAKGGSHKKIDEHNKILSLRDNIIYQNVHGALSANEKVRIAIITGKGHAVTARHHINQDTESDAHTINQPLGHRLFQEYDSEFGSVHLVGSKNVRGSKYDCSIYIPKCIVTTDFKEN